MLQSNDVQTVTLSNVEERVKELYQLDELELNHLYKLDDISVETPDGFSKAVGFVKKRGEKTIVEFNSGLVHTCLSNHIFIGDSSGVFARDLAPGNIVLTTDGIDYVKNVDCTGEDMIAYDLSISALNGIYVTADGIQHHNTGKTQTVEDVLHAEGLTDGDGYFKNTGTASAIGVYTTLYHHRDEIILFDDSDGALGDTDARNLIKAATDTKKIRKLVWNKKSSFIYNPDSADAEEYEDDDTMVPSHFDFKGKILFISNLPIKKLDPDGALGTRAFIVNVNPTQDEMFDFMSTIIDKIPLEGDHTLSKGQRQEVLAVVKTVKNKNGATLRTLVRALNLAASGVENWKDLCKLYA